MGRPALTQPAGHFRIEAVAFGVEDAVIVVLEAFFRYGVRRSLDVLTRPLPSVALRMRTSNRTNLPRVYSSHDRIPSEDRALAHACVIARPEQRFRRDKKFVRRVAWLRGKLFHETATGLEVIAGIQACRQMLPPQMHVAEHRPSSEPLAPEQQPSHTAVQERLRMRSEQCRGFFSDSASPVGCLRKCPYSAKKDTVPD